MKSHTPRTFQSPYRTLGARVFNLLGRQLRRWGLRRRLAMSDILDAACRWTKLSDWGDERFHEPLRVLLESLEEDARLNPLGRLLVRLNCIHFAANRLRVRHFLKNHPEALAEPVRRPIFVVGLPRTGTTLLHNLLCQARDSRPLLLWQALQPAPDADQPDRRRKRARRLVTTLNYWSEPQLKTVHPLRADGPEECTFLLFNTFVTPAFFLYGDVRGYGEWLRGPGRALLPWVYEQYRTYLQIVQWGGAPGHWVLKSPAHSFGLEALRATFPDACVVRTHRDMNEVIPSACSLFAISHGIYSDEVNCRRLGPEISSLLSSQLLDRLGEDRAANPSGVFDVHYRSLVSDPIGVIRSIHTYFSLGSDDLMEERMRRWLAKNPANKHGAHRYDLEQFGLTRADVERTFGPYQSQLALTSSGGGDQVGRLLSPPPQKM